MPERTQKFQNSAIHLTALVAVSKTKSVQKHNYAQKIEPSSLNFRFSLRYIENPAILPTATLPVINSTYKQELRLCKKNRKPTSKISKSQIRLFATCLCSGIWLSSNFTSYSIAAVSLAKVTATAGMIAVHLFTTSPSLGYDKFLQEDNHQNRSS